MSRYNSYVGAVAEKLQDSNMQMHMGTMSSDVSSEQQKILKHLIDYEYGEFINIIYETVLGDNEKYSDGKYAKDFLHENERDLIPIFVKMNEDCLNDVEFSKAIVNGELYTKNMGMKKDNVLYYPEHHVGSMSNDIIMNLLYIPSIKAEYPNVFRIDVKEILEGEKEYPYINFSVDIGDDGSIKYNQPIIVKENNSNVTKIPSDMSLAHIRFNENGIVGLRDMFIDLFEKTGIKENNDTKHK